MLGHSRLTFWRAPSGGGGGGGPAGAPTNLANSASTTSSITLSWTNGDATADTELYRDNVLVTTIAAGTATYDDTGRSANATHDYKIRHSKGGLFSSFNGPITAYSVPNPPTGLSATADSDTQITLTWTDAHTLSVLVYRDAAYIATVSAGVQTYVDTGLTANTLYAYVLRHQNSGWQSADSTGDSATTDNTDGPDAPPSGLTVEATDFLTWTLTWTNGDATAATEVYEDGALIDTVTAGGTTTDRSIFPAGSTHTYKVRHIKNSITSAYSSEVTKTFPSVTGVDASGNDATDEFDFSWTAETTGAPSGWDALLTWNDDLAYPTDQTQSVGQSNTGSSDVSTNYDVNPGGSVIVYVDVTVSIRTSGAVVLATGTATAEAIVVEPII